MPDDIFDNMGLVSGTIRGTAPEEPKPEGGIDYSINEDGTVLAYMDGKEFWVSAHDLNEELIKQYMEAKAQGLTAGLDAEMLKQGLYTVGYGVTKKSASGGLSHHQVAALPVQKVKKHVKGHNSHHPDFTQFKSKKSALKHSKGKL